MPQVMEVSQLTKLISSIGTRRVSLDRATQEAAVQCIAQSIMHRNSTPAAHLFEVSGKGTRRDSLLVYFESFGNLMWSKVEGKVMFCDVSKLPGGKTLEWTDEYAERVEATFWSDAKPEPKMKSVFDVEEAVSKLIQTIEAKIKKEGVTVKHIDLYDSLAAAYYAHRSDLSNTRAEEAAFKGATLTQLVERFSLQPDAARALIAKAREANAAHEASVAPAVEPELIVAITEDRIAQLVDHFGKPDVKAA